MPHSLRVAGAEKAEGKVLPHGGAFACLRGLS